MVPDLRIGGAERHVVTLLPKLNPARFQPSLVCIGQEGELFNALSTSGIAARALNLEGKRNASRALRGLVSIMRHTRPDVVVTRGYNAEVLGRLAAILAGVENCIVWVHNIGDVKPRSPTRKIADRMLLAKTSAFFGVAHAQRAYLVDGLGCPDEKVRIIHNGVDPALFDCTSNRDVLAEFHIEPGDPVVAIVAGLRAEKDHITLLKAARIVVNEIPSVRFLVVGDGVLRADLETLCRELGIVGNIYFTGSRSDIAQLLRAIDVFTLSSVTVECFPFALLEAMACGRPAVCTDVGGVAEIVVEGVTGYLVQPNDPAQLAARIVDLLSNPEMGHRMGCAGRHRIESEFSLNESVRAAERAIEDVVYRRGNSRRRTPG